MTTLWATIVDTAWPIGTFDFLLIRYALATSPVADPAGISRFMNRLVHPMRNTSLKLAFLSKRMYQPRL